ncbi:MAG TPA: ATP-binding protein [Dissulfurispiraceae bacterium]|nr:ATP-binding protein [Dissulfurispiraceae bacterium]
MHGQQRGGSLTPFRIALIYALVGSLWILFSDLLVSQISFDTRIFAILSILKGWCYVATTSLLLYWLVSRYAVSSRKAAEAEIARESAEAANKAKSDFIAQISHELRTPLNSIIGFSEFLIESYSNTLEAAQKEYINNIHESGIHLLNLINDILDHSKIEAGRMELRVDRFPVEEIISGSVDLLSTTASKRGISIEADMHSAPKTLNGDRLRIKQVMLNLLNNAMKFTPEGGSIVISVRTVEAAAEFSVSDTGIGISAEDQGKLFKPFSQLGSRSSGGTGLGLSICRSIVEMHGGRIWVESSVGKGSTFTFTIPSTIQAEVGNER